VSSGSPPTICTQHSKRQISIAEIKGIESAFFSSNCSFGIAKCTPHVLTAAFPAYNFSANLDQDCKLWSYTGFDDAAEKCFRHQLAQLDMQSESWKPVPGAASGTHSAISRLQMYLQR